MKVKISVFMFLAAWLLMGCNSSLTGAAQNGIPSTQVGISGTAQHTPRVPPHTPSPTSASSPALPNTPEATPIPSPLLPAATTTPRETQSVPTDSARSDVSATPRPSPAPEEWKTWPVVPALSQKAKAIYLQGQALDRDPHRFSKVGDCQNITTYFLSHFENPDLYRLGEFASLQPAIDWFMGSFARESLAVKGGMNVAAVLSPLRADANICDQDESPLACEFRLYNPSFAIISMEEAWSGEPEKYGKYMRQVIEYTLEQGILPVIATKADNLEGGDRINAIIAQLAWEYDIPLWNFWAAVQPLSGHGLIEDGFHLTHGNNFFFDVSLNGQTGYTLRNLTVLQVINAIWMGLMNH
jgi:hypothetical protein